jgi:hypothetical protein
LTGLPAVMPVIKNSFNNVVTEKNLFVFFFILIIINMFLYGELFYLDYNIGFVPAKVQLEMRTLPFS